MQIYLTSFSEVEPKISIDLTVDETLAFERFLWDRYPRSAQWLTDLLVQNGEAHIPDAIERATRFVGGL